jgi:hypothetical protein
LNLAHAKTEATGHIKRKGKKRIPPPTKGTMLHTRKKEEKRKNRKKEENRKKRTKWRKRNKWETGVAGHWGVEKKKRKNWGGEKKKGKNQQKWGKSRDCSGTEGKRTAGSDLGYNDVIK